MHFFSQRSKGCLEILKHDVVWSSLVWLERHKSHSQDLEALWPSTVGLTGSDVPVTRRQKRIWLETIWRSVSVGPSAWQCHNSQACAQKPEPALDFFKCTTAYCTKWTSETLFSHLSSAITKHWWKTWCTSNSVCSLISSTQKEKHPA